ncbi:hypothetical protein C8A00DRAFT_34945 [Chaetomidium leptoderma]|uniref:Uncharacterized protein n=1 Tax=Chaetomidium leptoderma TaxID=669021 RepID=A0AAN6VIU7_9PEZI|nr:hypothetical protein C8A00DRAFT_34945 [Chaetomidium leptoderma]
MDRGSYQIAMYELCLSEKLTEEPICNATLAEGVGSVVVDKRQPVHGPTPDAENHHLIPHVLTAGPLGRSWDLRSSYFAARAFRDIALGLALREVNESLNALGPGLPDHTRAHGDSWFADYDRSRGLFGKLSRSPTTSLQPSLELIEAWRLSSLNSLLYLTPAIATHARADDAVRHLLVAEERLSRLEGGSQLPALYTLPESATASLTAITQELVQQVNDSQQRRYHSVSTGRFHGFLLAVVAFELRVFNIALSGVVDIVAPKFAQHPKLYICALAFVFSWLYYLVPPQGRRSATNFVTHLKIIAIIAYWLAWLLMSSTPSIQPLTPSQAFAGPEAEGFCKLILHAAAARETFPITILALCLLETWIDVGWKLGRRSSEDTAKSVLPLGRLWRRQRDQTVSRDDLLALFDDFVAGCALTGILGLACASLLDEPASEGPWRETFLFVGEFDHSSSL